MDIEKELNDALLKYGLKRNKAAIRRIKMALKKMLDGTPLLQTWDAPQPPHGNCYIWHNDDDAVPSFVCGQLYVLALKDVGIVFTSGGREERGREAYKQFNLTIGKGEEYAKAL